MTKSEVTNGETGKEGVKSYPCESALVGKTLTEVLVLDQGGRSQCAAVMRRNEGAAQRYSGGWRFGLIDARVSALAAKRICRILSADLGGSMRQTRRAFRVLRAATWRKRSCSSTIELPPRRQLRLAVTQRYKAVLKGVAHAGASGTSHLRPAAWGDQLDQSSRLGRKAKALKGRTAGSSVGQLAHGEVSSWTKAAIGPERASSRSNPRQAKQHSVKPEKRQTGRLVNRQVRKV
jgi:hypothetical protein